MSKKMVYFEVQSYEHRLSLSVIVNLLFHGLKQEAVVACVFSATTARRRRCTTAVGTQATAPSSVSRSTGMSSTSECVDANATDSDSQRRARLVPRFGHRQRG